MYFCFWKTFGGKSLAARQARTRSYVQLLGADFSTLIGSECAVKNMRFSFSENLIPPFLSFLNWNRNKQKNSKNAPFDPRPAKLISYTPNSNLSASWRDTEVLIS